MTSERTLGQAFGKSVLLIGFTAAIAFPATLTAFSFSGLRFGATNGPETYLFADGDKVVPIAQIDSGLVFRVTVLNPSGAVVHVTACGTNFASTDNGYTIRADDGPSTNGPYTMRVEQFVSCTNTQPVSAATRQFYVARAEAFINGSPTNRFTTTQVASVRVLGLPPSQPNWSVTWLTPIGTASCSNVAGTDRPDSSNVGVLPATNATYLSYPPINSAAEPWNDSANYDGNGAAFTSSSLGQWKIRLQKNATNVVTVPAFSVVDECMVAPLQDLTRGVMTEALFTADVAGPGPFSYAWLKNDGLLPGQTSASLLLTNLTLSDSGTYTVEVNGPCMTARRSATLSVISCAPTLDVMLVMDRSGSMLGQAFTDARTACTNLIRDLHLDSGDQVGLVSYNVTATLDQPLTNDASTVESAVSALPMPERGTSISLGIETARNELLSSRHDPLALPVMVLLSDGVPHSSGDNPSNVLFNARLAKTAGTLVFTIAVGEADPNLMSAVASASNTFFLATNSAQFTELFHRIATLLCRAPTNFVVDAMADQTVCSGDAAQFTVTAHGCNVLGYQWSREGVLLAGETNATFQVSEASSAIGGEYSVEVRGDCRTIIASARLHVVEPPLASSVSSQTTCAGGTAVLQAPVTGTPPLRFEWRRDGVLIEGETNAAMVLTNIPANASAEYSVVIANECAAVTNTIRLDVTAPLSALPLMDQTQCVGDVAIFATAFLDTAPESMLWRKDGEIMPGETNRYLVVPVASPDAAGRYAFEAAGQCNTVTNSAWLEVSDSVTATPLMNVGRCVGDAAIFSTTITSAESFTLRWSKDGVALPGETNATLLLSNLTVGDSGTYQVEIRGRCRTLTNAANLAVSPTTTATPMRSIAACTGSPVAFTTAPEGQGPFTFVWRRNGLVLTNQNGPNLIISSVTASNAGLYSVVISGACGAVTNSGTLSVANGLSATMPATLALCGCDDAVIAPMITGATPISFRWFRDGHLLPETNSVLWLPKANRATPGTYRVEIDGGCYVVTNSTIVSLGNATTGLFVNPQPISIPDFGAVDPYPSTLDVECAPKSISQLRVTLRNLSHDYPDDLDIMLVSPEGKALMLMSDAGGTSLNYIQNVTLGFSDAAEATLPDTRKLTNGIYLPTNFGVVGDDVFEGPAPEGPNISSLAGFNGTNPNGQWRLFVVDDHGLDRGVIAGGWSLDFGSTFTTDPELRLVAASLTNGVFRAELFGTAGTTAFIEGSADMRNWKVILTNQIVASPTVIEAADAAVFPYRFLRASSCK